VASAVGPNVNTFFISHIFKIEIFLIRQCEHIEGFTWIFLPNPIFVICLNFQQQNSLKKQYFSCLSSENCEIKSIKSDLWFLSTTPRTLPNSNTVLVWILFSFHWENGSIINSFYTIAPNSLNPVNTPLLIKSFLKIPRAWHEVRWFGRSQCEKTKQATNCVMSLP
jgi:hypothetical protein